MVRLTTLPILKERQSKSFWPFLVAFLVLFVNLANPMTAQALPMDPDAYYDGNSYYYDNKLFQSKGVVEAGDAIDSDSIIDPGDTYYFVQINDQMQIIRPDNPSQPTSARYLNLSYDTTTGKPIKIIESTNIKVVTVASNSSRRTCDVPYIGWILCPVTNALSSAADWLYGIIVRFLDTKPINMSQTKDNPVYVSWSIVRLIANIVFGIVFLIMIGSYVTGFGLSSYQVKTMFPKFFVISIMINLSFVFSAMAIDVSNIMGASIKSLFEAIQLQTMGENGVSLVNSISWTSLLSLTTLSYIASVGFLSGSAGIGGATLVIALGLLNVLGVLIGIIMALAARQAIILILVVIAPLALAASLMPNTEKYFKKWSETGFKMLSIYPAFSFIYGASLIASSLILSTAEGEGEWIMTLLGLLVRVMPFLLLFQLIRSADAIMDRFSNSATNGVNSLTENMTDKLNRELAIKKENYNGGKQLKGIGSFVRPRGWAQRFARGKQLDEMRLKEAQANNSAMYSKEKAKKDIKGRPVGRFAEQSVAMSAAEDSAKAYDQANKVSYQAYKAKVEAKSAKNKGDLNRFVRGSVDEQIAKAGLVKQIADMESKSMTGMIQEAQNKRIIDNITLPAGLDYANNTTLHTAMAGVNPDFKNVILSTVTDMQRRERAEFIKRQETLLNQSGISDADKLSIALKKDVRGSSIIARMTAANNETKTIQVKGRNGELITLDYNDKYLTYAAANIIGSQGMVDTAEMLQGATMEGGSQEGYREELAALIYSTSLRKNKQMVVKTADYIAQGLFRGDDTYFEIETENIASGRFSVNGILGHDKDAMETMARGLEKMVKNEPIKLANLDANGNIIQRGVFDHLVALKDGNVNEVKIGLKTFRDNLTFAMTDTEAKKTLQPQQIARMNRMIKSINSIVGPEPKAKKAQN